MKTVLSVLAIATLAFGLTAELHEQYRIGPGSVLEIDNINGDITITAVEGDEIIIDIIKKTKKDQAELDKVTVDITSGETFKVETRYLEDKTDVSVDISLQVPATVVEAFIENVNGSIDIEGITADLDIENANGDITVKRIQGTIDVELANGDIHIKGDAVIIEVDLANGTITAEIRALSEYGAQFAVANGAIKLYILETLKADIEADIVMGDIHVHDLEIDYSKEKQNVIEGSINGGGPLIEVGAATGSIALYKMED
ncbi:DUF4097 family beta strand repeat protein [candidate division WOR-3 bacterium]|nr:DUF4097 family beta strand repeat protein [candidate division WOR-3 bacterium]